MVARWSRKRVRTPDVNVGPTYLPHENGLAESPGGETAIKSWLHRVAHDAHGMRQKGLTG